MVKVRERQSELFVDSDFFVTTKVKPKKTKRVKTTDKENSPELGILPFLFPEDYPEAYIGQLLAKENITWLESDVYSLQEGLWLHLLATMKNKFESISSLDEVFIWIFLSDNESVFSFDEVCLSVTGFQPKHIRLSIINQIQQEVNQSKRLGLNTKVNEFYKKVLSKMSKDYDPSITLDHSELYAYF